MALQGFIRILSLVILWSFALFGARVGMVMFKGKTEGVISAQSDLRQGWMSADGIEEVLKSNLREFPRSLMPKLSKHIHDLSQKFEIDPAFILALIHVESTFKPTAISPVGAMGLMQVMPGTAQVVASRYGIRFTRPEALMDPFTNISLGVAYVHMLKERYKGLSPYFHVAAYNMGPTRLDSLRKDKGFKPGSTLKYYQKIKSMVPLMRLKKPLLVAQA